VAKSRNRASTSIVTLRRLRENPSQGAPPRISARQTPSLALVIARMRTRSWSERGCEAARRARAAHDKDMEPKLRASKRDDWGLRSDFAWSEVDLKGLRWGFARAAAELNGRRFRSTRIFVEDFVIWGDWEASGGAHLGERPGAACAARRLGFPLTVKGECPTKGDGRSGRAFWGGADFKKAVRFAWLLVGVLG
jgi:hypothetical protein